MLHISIKALKNVTSETWHHNHPIQALLVRTGNMRQFPASLFVMTRRQLSRKKAFASQQLSKRH